MVNSQPASNQAVIICPLAILLLVPFCSGKRRKRKSQTNAIKKSYVPLSLFCLLLTHLATAAKSLLSCPTLCDPTDGSPPGSLSLGFSRQILEWVAISFSNAYMHAKSLQLCQTLCDAMDSSPPGSSVHGILEARILEWVAISFYLTHLRVKLRKLTLFEFQH